MNNPNESAGHQHVSETGNYYAFARYYSPRLGRFMSAYPLGGVTENPQSLNRYAYVLNNPMSFTDPTGLVCEPDFPNSNCESPSQHFGGGGFMGIDEFQLLQIPLTYTYYGFGPAQQGPSGIDATGTYSYAIRFWVWGLHTGTLFGSGFEFFSYANSWGGTGSSPLTPQAPQTTAPSHGTPWYKNSCLTGALGAGLLHVGIDAIGLIPEAGGFARVIGHQAGYVGVVADQVGSGVINAAGKTASAAQSLAGLSDTSPEGLTSTGLTVAGFIPGANDIAAVASIIWDGHRTIEAIGKCN